VTLLGEASIAMGLGEVPIEAVSGCVQKKHEKSESLVTTEASRDEHR
jgi:hypothetical protein